MILSEMSLKKIVINFIKDDKNFVVILTASNEASNSHQDSLKLMSFDDLIHGQNFVYISHNGSDAPP